MAKSKPGDNKTVPAVLTGLLLFHILFASNLALSTGFLEETWTRSLLNLMVTPLRETEYLIGTAVFGLSKVFIGMVFVSCTALLFYAFNVTTIAVQLIPCAIILLFMGWVLALFVIGLVLRFGAGAEVLAWALAFLLWPLSGAFYAVGALPAVLQPIAECCPRPTRSRPPEPWSPASRCRGTRSRSPPSAPSCSRPSRSGGCGRASSSSASGATSLATRERGFHRADVVRHDLVALGPVEEIGEMLGQRGALADRLLDGVWELRRMRGRERDHGMSGSRCATSTARNPTAVCGSTTTPDPAYVRAIWSRVPCSSTLAAVNVACRSRS